MSSFWWSLSRFDCWMCDFADEKGLDRPAVGLGSFLVDADLIWSSDWREAEGSSSSTLIFLAVNTAIKSGSSTSALRDLMLQPDKSTKRSSSSSSSCLAVSLAQLTAALLLDCPPQSEPMLAAGNAGTCLCLSVSGDSISRCLTERVNLTSGPTGAGATGLTGAGASGPTGAAATGLTGAEATGRTWAAALARPPAFLCAMDRFVKGAGLAGFFPAAL